MFDTYVYSILGIMYDVDHGNPLFYLTVLFQTAEGNTVSSCPYVAPTLPKGTGVTIMDFATLDYLD